MEKLRFAPIIRVSTEKQEKRGESLLTQKEQIIQYVENLHGVIPDICWQYSGQESATANHERKLLDKMLNDSAKGVFDAVICVDASRWSRDNLKSKEGLQILRDNNIRFFVNTMEYDLYNPEHNFYLGVSAEIGELQARQSSLKSITNRINKAKKGIPASGLLPHGRTFNKKTNTWGIDAEKKKIIETCAKRYLKGESLKDIAKTYNMDYTNLHTILFRNSGENYVCRFRYANIDETVTMKIPRLLSEKTIEAMKQHAESRKTYFHGSIKNKYLLSRMIFCSKCGYTFTGFTSSSGRQYYRHARYGRLACKEPRQIDAIDIDNAVLIQLIKTFGSPDAMDKAIRQATPDMEKVEGLLKEKEQLTKDLKKIISKKDNVIELYSEGLSTKDEVKKSMTKLRERETAINERLSAIKNEISNVPDPEQVKKLSYWSGKIISTAEMKNPISIFKKSFEWKKKLVQSAFSGKDSKGKRLGVYLTKENNKIKFEIRGILENTLMHLPLSDEYLINAFNIDTEFQDIEKELTTIRNKLTLPKQWHSTTYFTINGIV